MSLSTESANSDIPDKEGDITGRTEEPAAGTRPSQAEPDHNTTEESLPAGWQPALFHIDAEGQKTPFCDWLKEQKNASGYTWESLENHLGFRARMYCSDNNDSHPVEPRGRRLATIAKFFGESPLRFHRNGSLANAPDREYDRDKYNECVVMLGDKLRELNRRPGRRQKLSTYVIRNILGEDFHSQYGRTRKLRASLLKDLHELGYTEIMLSTQTQNRGRIRALSRMEHNILNAVIEDMFLESGGDPPIIAACVRTAHRNLLQLSQDGSPRRSLGSVRYHIEKMLGVQKRVLLERGSPISSGSDVLSQMLSEKCNDLSSNPELEDPDCPIIPPDPEHKRRSTYFRFAPFKHQALIAYLMDPAHYQKIFGEQSNLIKVDFSESDTPEDLYEAFADRLDQLSDDESLQTTQFVDGWLRCDMIFYSPHIGFIVVEVKQHAQDTSRFPNGTKARQQLAGYSAVIHDNISVRNRRAGKTPMDSRVSGALVAFDISDDIVNDLICNERRAIEIPENEVMRYVTHEIARYQQGDEAREVQGDAQDAASEEQNTGRLELIEQHEQGPNQDDSIEDIVEPSFREGEYEAALEVQQEMLSKNSPMEERVAAFLNIRFDTIAGITDELAREKEEEAK